MSEPESGGIDETGSEHEHERENEGENRDGTVTPFRFVYLFGIGFNMIALSYALSIGEMLYAVTFVFIMVYLAIRYRMLSNR